MAISKNFYIVPYKMGSKSATALGQALGVKRVDKERNRLVGKNTKTVLNWGNSDIQHQEILKCRILNSPEAVRKAADKLSFFSAMGDSPIVPKWTTDHARAVEWVSDGKTVFGRKVLTGHSGNGIIVMNSDNQDQWQPCPLYTMYMPKKEEYRVHFFKDKVIFVQRKAMVKDFQNPNFQIRNLQNGFIYANQNIELPVPVQQVVTNFLDDHNALGLDFGAIDVIYNQKADKALILEVNSAPGLQGSTLNAYVEAIRAV